MMHLQIPGTGPSEHTLKPDEMELGMGIHNEPGVKRIKIPSARELLAQMVDFASDTANKDRSFVPFKHDGSDEIVLMINNLGGTSELEMGGITSAAMEYVSPSFHQCSRPRRLTCARLPAGHARPRASKCGDCSSAPTSCVAGRTRTLSMSLAD
jgi:hypothetical protein